MASMRSKFPDQMTTARRGRCPGTEFCVHVASSVLGGRPQGACLFASHSCGRRDDQAVLLPLHGAKRAAARGVAAAARRPGRWLAAAHAVPAVAHVGDDGRAGAHLPRDEPALLRGAAPNLRLGVHTHPAEQDRLHSSALETPAEQGAAMCVGGAAACASVGDCGAFVEGAPHAPKGRRAGGIALGVRLHACAWIGIRGPGDVAGPL
eukprot:430245-Pleurochrysis_carterae.AAC.2